MAIPFGTGFAHHTPGGLGGRRPAKRTAARGRGFACSMLPGCHPGLLGPVPAPIACVWVVKIRFAAGSLQRRRSVELLPAAAKLAPRASRNGTAKPDRPETHHQFQEADWLDDGARGASCAQTPMVSTVGMRRILLGQTCCPVCGLSVDKSNLWPWSWTAKAARFRRQKPVLLRWEIADILSTREAKLPDGRQRPTGV